MLATSSGLSWLPSPDTSTLERNEIHVWRARLDLVGSRVEDLHHFLSSDERVRAERFYFQKDREHFVVARWLLRAILGRYLRMDPAQLRFRYNSYGKPALASELGAHGLRFNVSHSHGFALFALTRDREIGVDLEHIRPISEAKQIAERFFSRREVTMLRALPAPQQQHAFFTCWTRKEAYVKARGEGLSLPLDQFDVSLHPGEPARLLRVERDPQEAARWSLQGLTPAPGYVAALAVEGHGWRLACWEWQEV